MQDWCQNRVHLGVRPERNELTAASACRLHDVVGLIPHTLPMNHNTTCYRARSTTERNVSRAMSSRISGVMYSGLS